MISKKIKSQLTNGKCSILQIQKSLLTQAFNCSDSTLSWKILVFDNQNRSIVSSHLKMKDLRDHNITLYLSLTQNREQIHGVSVMYLIQPTLENVDVIANDLLDDMYTSVQIHFSSQPAQRILQALANKLNASKKNQVIAKITKIQYSCLGFYCIDNNMCVLPSQIEIVNLLRVLECAPIFIYNNSSMQSKNLVQKIKTKLTSISLESGLVKSEGNRFSLMYIFTRQSDQFPVIAHGITYASLIQNLYKINKTGCRVTKNKQNVQLTLQDEIWLDKKNYLISQMKLGEQSNQITSKLIGLSSQQYSQNNQKLKKIQWHLNNAGQMLSVAKNRRLNQFYQAELQIYNKGFISKQLKNDIITLLKESSQPQDKIRLLLIYILYADTLDEVQQFQSAFTQINNNNRYKDLKEKKLKGLMPESASNKYFKKFAKGIWKNLTSNDKKFRISKQFDRVRACDFSELSQIGMEIDSTITIPAHLKIQNSIIYCLGGSCFHQYANLIDTNPDLIYASDQLISFRDLL